MKHTPLTSVHEKLGAKMVEFAGYLMPVIYTSIKEEHLAVRRAAGIFDVSHMGEFLIEGPGATALVQKLSSNDIEKIASGQAQYGCMPNAEGGIVDDMITYKLAEDRYLMVVNAANLQKDWDWVNSHAGDDVKLTDQSEEYALLAVQGPKATQCLQPLTDVDLGGIGFYHFEIGTFAGMPDVIISGTGYTGSGGFELYIPAESAQTVWTKIMEHGAAHGLIPAGLGARDTLRLEMGYCLYGNDIDDTTNPYEAGLGWITKPETGFIASDIIAKAKADGLKRKLVGLEMIDRGIPRQGYEICDADGRFLGHVTSGTQSPLTGKSIGMGYVETAFSKKETEVFISVRNKQLKAKVVRPPFAEV